GSFTITVGDSVPPVVTVPPSIIAEATSSSGAVVNFTASATDDVDGTVAVVCAPVSGSTFPIGVTSVTCTAHDSSGNVGMASFNDTTPPTIRSLTATPTNIWPENHKMVDVTILADVVDNCDTAPVTRIVSVTANQPVIDPGSGNTSPDYIITGNLTLTLRAE